MAKPTVLPRWATDVSADVTEPASGTKDVGYVDGGIPEAGELNWLLFNGYEWDLWLSTFEDTAHNWNGAQAFYSDLDVYTGSNIFHAGSSGVAVGSTAPFTVGSASTFNGAATHNSSLTISEGAGNTGILYDGNVSNPAVSLTSDHYSTLKVYNSDAAPAIDISEGNAYFSGTAPGKNDGGTQNFLSKANICKAWGRISCTSGGTITLDDGYNVTSVTFDGVDGFTVTLAAPFSSANYCVTANGSWDATNGVIRNAAATISTAGVFKIRIHNGSTLVNPNSGVAQTLSFTCFGRQ